jgi:hypothetical protein
MQLQFWACQWINSCLMPINLYGTWPSLMLDDGNLAWQIHKHLQELGVCRKAEDVVWFLEKPGVQEEFHLKKGITLATVQRWMATMHYCWRKNSKGGETTYSHHH